jgi:predicted nucleic acid-binding protein
VLLANGDARARARVQAARAAGDELVIPAVVLAEVTRGRPTDAPVNRVIKAVGVLPGVDESVGRRAGALLDATTLNSTIDAIVVASSLAAGASAIIHHDADDLPPLCAAAGIADWHIK